MQYGFSPFRCVHEVIFGIDYFQYVVQFPSSDICDHVANADVVEYELRFGLKDSVKIKFTNLIVSVQANTSAKCSKSLR